VGVDRAFPGSGTLNELRAVLGNDVAIKAYREGTLPFPDGTVLARPAWKHVQSPEFEAASIPGATTTVQIMVKDSKRYVATGGWGSGRFMNGKPVDEAQHQTCWACHEARAEGTTSSSPDSRHEASGHEVTKPM
jgi:Cytochrome P460